MTTLDILNLARKNCILVTHIKTIGITPYGVQAEYGNGNDVM